MTIVPWFSTFSKVSADPARIVMPSGSVGVTLRSFAVSYAAWLTHPIGVRLFLLEDSVIVFAILLALDGTGRIALTCLSYVVIRHIKKFDTLTQGHGSMSQMSVGYEVMPIPLLLENLRPRIQRPLTDLPKYAESLHGADCQHCARFPRTP